MKTVELGKHKVTLYDSIDEIPMKRYHRFNKMMLVDSGIGTDLSDIDKHLNRIKSFIVGKKDDMAIREVENLRTNIYFVTQNLCPRYLAFAALVTEIDGEPMDDLSDEGLQKVVDKLSDIPMPSLNEEFEDVKKKIDDDLLQYFPDIFDDSSVKEYYDTVRKRTLAILKGITDGETEEIRSDIDKLTMELLTYSKPQSFSGADNAEIIFDKNFDKMCHLISYHLNVSPKDYTVMEFYSAFEYIKELVKTKTQSLKKI